MCFLKFGAGQTLLRKDVQIYFPKKFDARKYFFEFFVKIEKVLEKFLACKSVLKIQICSGKNQKSREKQKMVESKYEIRTDLPSARARRFESDAWNLSSALFTIVWPVLENWMRTNSRPYATSSSHVFF